RRSRAAGLRWSRRRGAEPRSGRPGTPRAQAWTPGRCYPGGPVVISAVPNGLVASGRVRRAPARPCPLRPDAAQPSGAVGPFGHDRCQAPAVAGNARGELSDGGLQLRLDPRGCGGQSLRVARLDDHLDLGAALEAGVRAEQDVRMAAGHLLEDADDPAL